MPEESHLNVASLAQTRDANNNGQTNGKTSVGIQAKSFSNESKHVASSEDLRELIPQLCNQFYHLGWASGTGGGLSIRQSGRIYCAPSGVQKERIKPNDMFLLDESLNVLESPQDANLKQSECLRLFNLSFKLRDAGCCIHSHSIYANLVCSLPSFQEAKEFKVTKQEMIKGIKIGSTDVAHKYTDTLIVPIIDNVLYERDLVDSMQWAIRDYPDSNAILVRNHGVYIWGKDWRQAKSMAECYHYLFQIAVEQFRLGLMPN